jgi:hypothetical protein
LGMVLYFDDDRRECLGQWKRRLQGHTNLQTFVLVFGLQVSILEQADIFCQTHRQGSKCYRRPGRRARFRRIAIPRAPRVVQQVWECS